MNNLTINQGDSCYLTIIHMDDDNETVIPFEEGDTIILSAKRKINQKEFDIKSKPARLIEGDLIIELTPEDTNIPLGDYYYDIQLTNVAEDVYTITKGMLTIDWDVSD